MNDISKSILWLSTITGLTLGITIATRIEAKDLRQQQLHMITAVCEWSLSNANKSLCYKLEDTTHTEFLCKTNNVCWTEQK